MRLHRLRMTAFGPFGGDAGVDFDDLSAAGLFLLHGPTGAGKTSVLDAVCYALYGSVPGARQSGQSLRSDHADPHTSTEILLDVTVGGRRLEITRRPEQARPKRRGAGYTRDRAQTWLRERADGEWKALSHSHQEAGEEIAQLVGMSKEQFCQVALLPQGDFARFLRADAEARGKLLGRLFDTRRFAAVEERLAELRRAAEKEVLAADDRLLALAHRMQQAAGTSAQDTGLPDLWLADRGEQAAAVPGQRSAGRSRNRRGRPDGPSGPDPSPGPAVPEPGGPGLVDAVLGWAAVARSSARERHTVAATAVRLAEEAHAAAAQELETAQELAHRQERFAGARRRREALDAVREEREQLCVRLERGRSAGAVAPALQLRKAAESARGEAREGVTRTRGPLPAELRDATHHLLTEAVRTARQELGSLAAARRAEEQAVALASELDALERDSRADDDLLAEAANWLADWDAVREEHRRRVEHAGEAATRAEQIAGRLGPARGRLEAARRRDGLTERISVAEDALLRARTKAAAAHERWLGLRDRRLRDIAAELAAELRDGQECAVCGAVEHPRPARASADHVDRHTEETALAVHRESEQRREETEHSLRSLCEARAAADTEADGAGTAGLAADAAGLERALATARAAAADAHTAREALDRAEREHTERLAQHEAAARRGAARTSRREALLSQQVLLDKEVVLARGTAASVAERAGDLQIRAGLLEAAAEAARDLEAAAERLAEADARLADACRTAGFPTPQDATAAVLHPAELRALQERLDAWQAEDAAVSAELSDPALAAAGVRLPADPARAREALETATRRRLRAVSAADEAATCCAELDRLSARATADARQLAPLRESYERVARLASLAAGTSAENEHRMRLESYVLAARLEQVAAAASVRLHRMSAGRYTLVHSDARASGRGRSGLGLHVIDAWTGSERDTATLSGGESFFASLALALGLADVVTEEAGGTRLDTLFIDEGFGSLDEQTLDDVLDVLDSLREQDRTVGIVSHVPDLRQRIPVQLEVVKGRSGSVVRHRGADASG